MASAAAGMKARLAEARRERPVLHHAISTQEHYVRANGTALAGGVTYYGFLSFFPILALGFFVVGRLATVYPEARANFISWINQAMPGIVGTDQGEIPISSIERAATTVGVLGVLGLLYTGLMWLTMMRQGLQAVFDVPRTDYPSFVLGKLRDLVTLVILGVILVVSVGVTGLVVGFSDRVLDLLGLGPGLTWGVTVLGALVGLLTNTVLFFALFTLLARPPLPKGALRSGALLGGVAFELLKEASSYLLTLTQKSPAFQTFGIALILLVWINYFSRIVMYAAAWAYTAPSAEALRAAETAATAAVPERPEPAAPPRRSDPRVAFGAGAATALAMVAALRRRRRG
jgi:membrane protein